MKFIATEIDESFKLYENIIFERFVSQLPNRHIIPDRNFCQSQNKLEISTTYSLQRQLLNFLKYRSNQGAISHELDCKSIFNLIQE
jgi:hypothetical protein